MGAYIITPKLVSVSDFLRSTVISRNRDRLVLILRPIFGIILLLSDWIYQFYRLGLSIELPFIHDR